MVVSFLLGVPLHFLGSVWLLAPLGACYTVGADLVTVKLKTRNKGREKQIVLGGLALQLADSTKTRTSGKKVFLKERKKEKGRLRCHFSTVFVAPTPPPGF